MAICHLAVASFCHLANNLPMANRIREVRRSKDVTLEALAEETGISTSYLSRTLPPSLPATVQEEIEREVGPLLPQAQRERIVTRIARVISTEMFSGPIAHPRHLREYELILPGSAERIVQMAENAQDHNRDMDQQAMKGTLFMAKASMVLGFVTLVILVGAAVYAGMNGNNTLAGLLLGAGLLGAAGKLIRGERETGNGS